ncbi:MAG: peptidylprolyl isomerase [Ignavibacteriales bacterium]|nr:peptidylprolyl isomerase [Ignavibacteriales bacterium]
MFKSLISVFLVMLILGCNNSKKTEGAAMQEADSTKSKESTVDMNSIEKVISKTPDSITVATITTKLGNIEVELYTNDAPKTTRNFIGLSMMGFFNNIIFHRVSKGFVIQGGDPTGSGSGGSSIYGGEFEDELNPETNSYKNGYDRGVLAMANKGENTNTSQFFIMLSDVPQMPKKYTIFGKVIKGMNVVDKIAAGKIVPQMGPTDGKPEQPIAMEKVSVEKRVSKINSIFDTK